MTMARRPAPPVAYGDDLAFPIASPDATEVRAPAKEDPPAAVEDDRTGRRPILDKSAPTLIYLHPAGKHQLRQYAVSQGLKTKVHDLMLEALEEWGSKRGLAGPWRVQPSKPSR
jgi:hypothetical protein